MNEEGIAEFEKGLPEKDRADWQRYQMSLSVAERRMQGDAMRNVRMTLRYLDKEVGEGAHSDLTEAEKSSFIRMMLNQLSQLEHISFEAWRETRRARIAMTISAAVNFSLCVLLLLAVFVAGYRI